MKERKLNEKESLELIAQMIQNSKKNLQVGRGNQFILWGWVGAITSIAVMGMLMLTNNPMWNWLWFAIPAIGWPLMMWQMKKEEKPVITFTDKVLKSVWLSIGVIGMTGLLLMGFYNLLCRFFSLSAILEAKSPLGLKSDLFSPES